VKKKISNFLQQYCGHISGSAITIGEVLLAIIFTILLWQIIINILI